MQNILYLECILQIFISRAELRIQKKKWILILACDSHFAKANGITQHEH
jgi:hypothetical protein